jgi:hypothetical protein
MNRPMEDVKPLIEIQEPEVEIQVDPFEEVEKQVTVHCSIPCPAGGGLRIWPSTYLVTEDGTKISLVHWEGISLAPEWTRVNKEQNYRFTLIFAGLPSSCKAFSLEEIIPEPGGFHVGNIKRNKTDVYKVQLS